MAGGVARGDVRLYRFAPPDKSRPVVVLTRDSAIGYLSTVTVAPITSTMRGVPSEVVLNEGGWHEGHLRCEPAQCNDCLAGSIGQACRPPEFPAHERNLLGSSLHARLRCGSILGQPHPQHRRQPHRFAPFRFPFLPAVLPLCSRAHFSLAQLCYDKDDCSSCRRTGYFPALRGASAQAAGVNP